LEGNIGTCKVLSRTAKVPLGFSFIYFVLDFMLDSLKILQQHCLWNKRHFNV